MKEFLQKITGSPLRTKFLLYFIIFTTIPVLLLGAVSLALIDRSHQQDVSTLELQLVKQKIEETEKFFASTVGLIEITVGYEQHDEIELAQQFFILDDLLKQNDAFSEVSFASIEEATYGIETAKRNRFDEAPQIFNVSLLPKFIEAKKGKTYISPVYYTLEGSFVTISAPVRNRNGTIVQILSAEVQLKQIEQSINSAVLGASGGMILADQDGHIIAHRDSTLRGKDWNSVFAVQRVLGGVEVNGLKPADRYKSIFYHEPVVAAGKRMDSLGWAFIVEWPLSDANAVMNSVRNQVLVMTLASIVAVLVFAPIVASRLTKPINALKRGTQEIEQGNFDKEVVITTHDELEELGSAFNRMSKGLKRLEELKSEFVYIAAHELRAPVTAIKGYVSLLTENTAKNRITIEAAEFLDRIGKANEGLVHLINDLLEVARSDAGKIEIAVTSVDVGITTERVIKTLSVLAEQKAITIEYQMVKTNVLADVDKLKEILTNLISNAIKYTLGKGGITIWHEIKENMVITHVEDTGMGISVEAQKKLFEKFYRVKAKGTEEVTGTGLGLFIVKQLVEKMHGKIWMESIEGKGSTFSFSLPMSS